MSNDKVVEVAAALIRRNDTFLICQRPAHKARGLLWEFVGGKLEEGESGDNALVRECREELGVTVKVIGKFTEVTHRYPDIRIRLTVYEAEIEEGEPQLLEHAAIKWITADEIKNYQFCPADRKILERIKKEFAEMDGKRKKRLGDSGEELAAKHLKRLGFKILQRNWRTPFCEVDIIARKGETIVFCEVKTRLTQSYGAPSEAVNGRKQSLYIKAAHNYLRGDEDKFIVRFDIIEVLRGEINHIENAFHA